ncbi:MAG: heat-inducible transcriptional repressor HrcA [Actinomycetaceae bacterium]|nr:heat-inducible transcriptional repressor HrcA [Arcanobacterium sp.]MDD7505394.1 heat-inducible transcriptional repressor HrcA [Actinomycetaceae bacterium]MDY6142924.1 heat-inducible transcriptional repressor HrcA [Arcanobacterium sp.]
MQSAEDRRKIVLNAIIEDYVATREPVGSKAIVERHDLGVSSATIRNDMALLEGAGLIVQPHTSAGRIPTDAGYRAFVDSLAQIKPLSRAERTAIHKILVGAVDLDDVLQRTVRLLAQLTHQVAVVQYPSLRKTALRHVELVPLSERLVLLVIITDAGRVEQRTIGTERNLSADDLDAVRKAVNSVFAGLQLKDFDDAEENVTSDVDPQLRDDVNTVVRHVANVLQNEVEERVVVAGAANLSRSNVDFAQTIAPVLDALEEQVVLLRILQHEDDGMRVSIGHENADESLAETSIVSAGYAGPDNTTVARLGIIGPTRMDYSGAMSSVYAIAKYLSDILAGR